MLQAPNLDVISTVIAPERLLKYEQPDGDKYNAIARYVWNARLGASLYPTLMHLEVAFRNRLHDAISSRYPAGPWRDVPCWLGRVPPVLARAELARVNLATRRLQRAGEAIQVGRVVAALTFGFWTSLLEIRYERRQVLWPPLLEVAFPHLPATNRTRRVVARRFDAIRRLRNRIYHYEPIWHWRDVADHHAAMLEAMGWLSPELVGVVKADDRFPVTYADGWQACVLVVRDAA